MIKYTSEQIQSRIEEVEKKLRHSKKLKKEFKNQKNIKLNYTKCKKEEKIEKDTLLYFLDKLNIKDSMKLFELVKNTITEVNKQKLTSFAKKAIKKNSLKDIAFFVVNINSRMKTNDGSLRDKEKEAALILIKKINKYTNGGF